MKLARFKVGNQTLTGIVEEENIKEITGNPFGEWAFTGKTFSSEDVALLAPIVPNQIIGIGANYVSERGELPSELPAIPVFFFKPVSSVIGPEEQIVIPMGIEQVKFESELAVVIGKQAKDISEAEVMDCIFGYTIGNDVTAPQFFRNDGHWMIGKSFDTFTPLGPVIETEFDPAKARVKAALNGDIKQNSSTDLMIISIRKMISYLSSVMTLQPGDVILTGSPAGAEFAGAEDVIACEIEGIGQLENSFVLAEEKEIVHK